MAHNNFGGWIQSWVFVCLRGVSLACVSEIFHEASRLFRTAHESRAKERQSAPTVQHDESETQNSMIDAGAAIAPGGRVFVCNAIVV